MFFTTVSKCMHSIGFSLCELLRRLGSLVSLQSLEILLKICNHDRFLASSCFSRIIVPRAWNDVRYIEDYFERLGRLYRNQVCSWTVRCFKTITNLDDVVSSSFNLIQSSTYKRTKNKIQINNHTPNIQFCPMLEMKRKLRFDKRHGVRLRLVWAQTSSLI